MKIPQFEMFEEVNRYMKSFCILSQHAGCCLPTTQPSRIDPACEVWLGYSLLAVHSAWNIYLQ